jgi:hypothetical protein
MNFFKNNVQFSVVKVLFDELYVYSIAPPKLYNFWDWMFYTLAFTCTRKEIQTGEVGRFSTSIFEHRSLGQNLSVPRGVTKRCRLSLLTNSALLIRVQMRGEGGSCGVSANEHSCAHHVTWSPNKLWRSTSIFNLWRTVYIIWTRLWYSSITQTYCSCPKKGSNISMLDNSVALLTFLTYSPCLVAILIAFSLAGL